MKLLDDYFVLQKQIYDYFGYKEDWVVIPIDDRREWYWYLTGEDYGGEVNYCISKQNLILWKEHDWDFEAEGVDGDDCYTNEIYTQRHLPKWVYPGKEYTMIAVDTHTDNNKFLAIYDNAKKYE